MKKRYILQRLLGFSLALTLLGCEKEGSSEYGSEVAFYKFNQLQNLFDNEILPLSSSFVREVETLNNNVLEFQSTSTLAQILIIQDQWKKVQRQWKQLELYDIGAIADSFISFEINRWPSDTLRIIDNINGNELISEDFIASLGSSSKGISAIEYLLFKTDKETSLATFTTQVNAVRRRAYLLALTENLKTKSEQLHALWTSNEVAFTSALENGISGSQNQVINAMVTLIEEIIISKLGNPLGDSNGGVVKPERLEAFRSGYSKDIIEQHLRALERCFKGDFALTPFRVGFDDFLILIGSENLSQKIAGQLIVCQQHLDAIDGKLETEISNNTNAVLALKNSFRELLVLIKVDMANVLGSTITFNDNDGD